MSDAWNGQRLHFVGIAGAGLSAYALAAKALGAEVTGSDRSESPYLARVREAGIGVSIGHAAQNLPEGDGLEVVVSTAIPRDNPEIAAALERGIPVLRRAELLARLTREKKTISVAGAHGKTTTTSMVAHALLATGQEPSYLIGGVLSTTGTNAEWGSGDWLVVEADESDRSFLALDTDVAVVTNVELDHHTEWTGGTTELRQAFAQFLDGPAHAVLPQDDPDVLALRAAETVEFGPWSGPELRVPGEHNRRNASAALEACVLAGADRAQAAEALATFAGAGRRFERLGAMSTGAEVVDDYAHHPTEVAATIAAARDTTPAGRVIAIFQPHLFSRTQHLARRFGEALATADVVGLVDVYPARERQEDFPGITGLTLAEHAADAAPGKPVLWLRTFDQAEQVLRTLTRDGDLVLIVGAGDIDQLGRRLVAR
ncbi:MAG TPA: Mur ligase domain-containing protein [Solirubrobacteraceae bacterium]|nr:Mur ligase domain-containing protein [Solirubrobacteraceae bacterium]